MNSFVFHRRRMQQQPLFPCDHLLSIVPFFRFHLRRMQPLRSRGIHPSPSLSFHARRMQPRVPYPNTLVAHAAFVVDVTRGGIAFSRMQPRPTDTHPDPRERSMRPMRWSRCHYSSHAWQCACCMRCMRRNWWLPVGSDAVPSHVAVWGPQMLAYSLVYRLSWNLT